MHLLADLGNPWGPVSASDAEVAEEGTDIMQWLVQAEHCCWLWP